MVFSFWQFYYTINREEIFYFASKKYRIYADFGVSQTPIIIFIKEEITMLNLKEFKWTREPESCKIDNNSIEIITKPHTDLWQRTYYHFRNDNAPVLQISTDEKYFSFIVKTEFESKCRFDQCGIVMYLDSENWLKASIEYENEEFQHLGSVVTNHGYSDWVTKQLLQI